MRHPENRQTNTSLNSYFKDGLTKLKKNQQTGPKVVRTKKNRGFAEMVNPSINQKFKVHFDNLDNSDYDKEADKFFFTTNEVIAAQDW
jgi:hypothetical protein